MNTTHEPSVDDILRGLEAIYPNVNWEELDVYEEDSNGSMVKIQNPVIKLRGDLQPEVVESTEENDEPMDEYAETRDNFNKETEE